MILEVVVLKYGFGKVIKVSEVSGVSIVRLWLINQVNMKYHIT